MYITQDHARLMPQHGHLKWVSDCFVKNWLDRHGMK